MNVAAQSDSGRGQRPEQKPAQVRPANAEAIDSETGRYLESAVGPEEGREQEAHGPRGEMEILHQEWRGDAEIAAIYVADEDGNEDEGEERPAIVYDRFPRMTIAPSFMTKATPAGSVFGSE